LWRQRLGEDEKVPSSKKSLWLHYSQPEDIRDSLRAIRVLSRRQAEAACQNLAPKSTNRFSYRLMEFHMRRAIALSLLTAVSATLLSSCTIADAFKRGYVKGMNKGKDALVVEEMVKVESAVRKYAGVHGGKFPAKIDESFKDYYEGGFNYFTEKKEMPVNGNRPNIEALRHGKRPHLSPGVIEYNCVDGGDTYAIIGGAHDSRAITVSEDNDAVLVLPAPGSENDPSPGASREEGSETDSGTGSANESD
jgi:hypothetical protein